MTRKRCLKLLMGNNLTRDQAIEKIKRRQTCGTVDYDLIFRDLAMVNYWYSSDNITYASFRQGVTKIMNPTKMSLLLKRLFIKDAISGLNGEPVTFYFK